MARILLLLLAVSLCAAPGGAEELRGGWGVRLLQADETASPSAAPSGDSDAPTAAPSTAPSIADMGITTAEPTTEPTAAASESASDNSTSEPTMAPSIAGTTEPTGAPTEASTISPSTAASDAPTLVPSIGETEVPTLAPTFQQTSSPTSAPSTYQPSSATPTRLPTRRPSPVFHSDDETNQPTGSPTEDPLNAKLEESKEFGHMVNEVIIGLSAVAVVGVVVMLIVTSIRRKFGASSAYNTVASDGSERPKKNMFKKFEDYWDEESEDQSGRTSSTRKGASTNYDDYWDEKNDLSTHSNHPLNISLPKRS